MARKRKKPVTPRIAVTQTEPEIDVDPVPPIEPDVELVTPAPTTYKPPGSEVEPVSMSEPRAKTTQEQYGKYVPSRKWGVSTVGGIGTVLIMWASTGTFDTEETVGAITLAVTAISTYLIPNASGNPNEPESA